MSRIVLGAKAAPPTAGRGRTEFTRQCGRRAWQDPAASSLYRRLLATASMLALALAAATPVRAQTAWTGTTSTDWFTAGNWTAGVPTGSVTTIDTNSPNATVVGAAGAQANALYVGFSSTGTLTIQNGGTLTNGAGLVGFNSGATGNVTVDGVGSTWSSGFIDIGSAANATGTVTVKNGGAVSGSFTQIGDQSFGSNTVTVDGVGSTWTDSSYFMVGGLGRGALTIKNGGAVSDDTVYVGQQNTGTGTVIVDGAGSTWTNSNTLNVGNLGSGTLTISNGGAVSAADVILGTFGGSGTLNIGAASGQAAAAPGTLTTPTIEAGAGTGTIVFNHTSSNYTFAPTISGAVTVMVEAGTTILTATNTYSGATTISGGTLVVNGSIAMSSLTTVNAGGTLTGTGSVGNTAVNSGGMFAPGNSTPGSTMTVAGSLAFTSGALYVVSLNPSTASFATVTGSATLGGATVNAMFANGTYVAKQYTILTAGSVGGMFGSLVNTNLPSGFKTALAYDNNNAYLNIALNFTPPTSPNFGSGLNGNQQAVGNALTNFFNTTGGIPLVFGTLTPAGLSQVSGESATGSQQATFQAMTQFMGVMTDPFIAGRGDGFGAPGGAPTGYASTQKTGAVRDANAMFVKAPVVPFEARWSTWAAGFGGSQTTDGNTTTGSNSATSRIAGTAVGADYRFSPFTIAGFSLAGGGTSFSVVGSGSGHSDLFQAGAFIRHTVGPAYVSAALAYGWQDITTIRTVSVAGIDQLRAEFNANTFSGRLEGGYRFVSPWIGGIGITPYAAGQFTTFDLPAYAEQAVVGANTFALAYGAKSVTDTRSELGLRTDKSYAMQDGIFTLRGRVAWAHDFDPDRSIGATFQTLPGASFVVGGAAQASDSALVTASAEKKWLNGWSTAATFEGEFSNVTTSYAGKGVVRYSF
jgi:T5SS/PEP-CTERM-associated repeat protein/autotransporter-associated beta strand protein